MDVFQAFKLCRSYFNAQSAYRAVKENPSATQSEVKAALHTYMDAEEAACEAIAAWEAESPIQLQPIAGPAPHPALDAFIAGDSDAS